MILGVFTEVILFILSLFFPLFGVVFPASKVKNMLKNNIKTNVVSYIIIISFLTVLTGEAIVIYLILFFLSEVLFMVFRKYNKILSVDKVVITSFIITLAFFIVLFFSQQYLVSLEQEVKKAFLEAINKYKDIYKSANIDINQAKEFDFNYWSDYVKKYYLIMIFAYSLIISSVIYVVNDENIKINNSISYLFTLLFALSFLVENFYLKGNIYLINIMLMIKCSYALQVLLSIDNYYTRKGNMKYFVRSFIWVLPLMFLDLLFILGALGSFFKIKLIRNKESDMQ